MNDCIFCKIVDGVIPSDKVFENDDMIIIKDLNPQAKIHLLLIPKMHYENIEALAKENPELLRRCFETLPAITDGLGLKDGYRLITNKGDNGCQSVKHIHIHLLGGEKLAERMG